MTFYLMPWRFISKAEAREARVKPKWKKVENAQHHLDNILTRFQKKLAPLKKQLDEEVEKIKQAVSVQQKEKNSQQNSEASDVGVEESQKADAPDLP